MAIPSTVVRLICPNLKCKAILAVPQAARGKTVRCHACGNRVRIPATSTKTEAASASSEDTTE